MWMLAAQALERGLASMSPQRLTTKWSAVADHAARLKINRPGVSTFVSFSLRKPLAYTVLGTPKTAVGS